MAISSSRLSQLLVGVSLTCIAAPALAQQEEAASDSEGINTIIVTAQKRAQSADDIGIAINAFDAGQLEALGVDNVSDLAAVVPGFSQTETGVTGVPVYTIRGVGFDDYSSNSSSAVGIYVDEVSLPYPTMTRELQFDLDRVEVLKGPQGTLYGRNTTGGAINLISNRPTDNFEGGVQLGFGRFETFSAEGFVSGPLGDTVSARLAVITTQSRKGWQKSVSRSGDRLGEIDQVAGRFMLEWEPNADFSAMVKLHAYRDRSENTVPQYFAYVPLVPELAPFFPPPSPDLQPDLSDSRSADWDPNFVPKRNNDGFGASLTLTWNAGPIDITSISAYEWFDREESNDWDGTSLQNLDVLFDTAINAYSQELRFSGTMGGGFDWVVGGYLSHDRVTESWTAFGADSTIFLGVYEAVDTRYEQETDTVAGFAHVDWQFADQLTLTGGLRYTHESRNWSSCSYDVDGGLAFLYNSVDFGPIPGSADSFFLSSTPLNVGDCVTVNTDAGSFEVDPVTGNLTVFGGTSGVFSDRATYDNLSGKVGLNWEPTDDLLLYASASRGFKSGGYNGAAASSWVQLEPYRSETLTAYEIGFKANTWNRRLRATGALFRYDYDDKQIIGLIADDVFGLLTQIVNVPSSRINGAELELEFKPAREFFLRISGAYLDSEVRTFTGLNGVGEIVDFRGNPLPQTPEWQINGMAEYRAGMTTDLDWWVGADFAWSDEYRSSVDQSELYFVDDYSIFGARAGVGAADQSWSVSLWVRNLFNSTYYTSANISDDFWFRTPGAPRTWGIRTSLAF